MLPNKCPDIKTIRKFEEEYAEIDLSEDGILTSHVSRLWRLYNSHSDDNKLMDFDPRPTLRTFTIPMLGDTDGEVFMMVNGRSSLSPLEYENGCHCCGTSLNIIPHIGCLCFKCIERLGETNEHDDSYIMFSYVEREIEEFEELFEEPVILP